MRQVPLRVIERVLARVAIDGDCVVSTYSVGSHGYAQVGWHDDHGRTMALCHRVAWIAEHGEIPEGMTVDHICRNRRCINASHLRLLTNVDNARDNGPARRTHCPHGHAYDESNTIRTRNGHRACRACVRIHEQRRRPRGRRLL